jgi:DNA topoisomerase-1
VEEEFDVIAEGKENWREMLARFYKPFHETIGTVSETAERATGARVLGVDPPVARTDLRPHRPLRSHDPDRYRGG